MGLGKTESTSETSIPGMTAAERRIQQLQLQAAEQAAGALDLSGDISTEATPQQLDYIRRMQESTGEIARSQMEAGLRESMGQVEAGALARGIEGSSIEQVMQAINARDFQRQMNEMILSQQGQSAQQALNTGFANAELRLNRNQQLLNALLGTGGQVGGRGLQERMAQATTRGEQDVGTFGAMMQFGNTLSGFIPGSGGGEK